MQKCPQRPLIEGIVDRSARGGNQPAFHLHRRRVRGAGGDPRPAIAQAYDAAYLGERILGSERLGLARAPVAAGATSAAEETGLLDSLEGKAAATRA